jgi:uncharacterized membrane protein
MRISLVSLHNFEKVMKVLGSLGLLQEVTQKVMQAFHSRAHEVNISLRLLALILRSNCSNNFNKVLTIIDGHLLNYFLDLGFSLVLAQYC